MATKNLKTKIEWFVISRVREIREQRGLDQEDLAVHLNVSNSFIGQIESPKQKAKYNSNHLNQLAKLLNCSPKDFWPEKPV